MLFLVSIVFNQGYNLPIIEDTEVNELQNFVSAQNYELIGHDDKYLIFESKASFMILKIDFYTRFGENASSVLYNYSISIEYLYIIGYKKSISGSKSLSFYWYEENKIVILINENIDNINSKYFLFFCKNIDLTKKLLELYQGSFWDDSSKEKLDFFLKKLEENKDKPYNPGCADCAPVMENRADCAAVMENHRRENFMYYLKLSIKYSIVCLFPIIFVMIMLAIIL